MFVDEVIVHLSLLSDMLQRYNSNADFSETQINIWVER